MARSAHPETSRKGRGPLAAAIVVALILCFMPRSVLAWLNGPRRLIEYLIIPVSDPALAIASWFLPAAPKPDDPRVALLQKEIELYKKLLADAQKAIEDKQRLIATLQKGEAIGDGVFKQWPAAVTAISSTGAGGVISVRAGSSDGVEQRNTIATTNGVQLVGRVGGVDAVSSKVTLMTHKASGTIDGVITADDGTRRAQIRNLSPQVGKRVLKGQVQHSSPPVPDPKVGDIVRVDDSNNWPRSAQRLTIGAVTEVETLAGGRIVVTVKPTVDLERLGEVVLLLSPKSEGAASGTGGGGGP
jgi:cell shape-determining protein MreC